MATEYGVFNDEGCIEDQLWSVGEAESAAARYRSEGDEFAKACEVCPDHEGQPREGCEVCEGHDEQGESDEDEGQDGDDDTQRTIWGDRAERLLEDALCQLRSGRDALPEISAAEAALRIEVGQLSPSEMDDYPFPGEDRDEICTCPPDLRARGGFTSTCRAHTTLQHS